MTGSETGVPWLTFILNTLLLIAWEFITATRQWLSERWPVRLLATAGGVPLTWLVLRSIFVYDNGTFLSELPALAALVWAIWLAVMYVVYRRTKPDLFMLAGCCLSGITVVISYLGKHMLEDGSAGSFLVLSLMVIGMGAGAAYWLKNVHRECQS
jgi:Na+-translocating ferredoxin:NAD+ oxidoreductase RnfA subunit